MFTILEMVQLLELVKKAQTTLQNYSPNNPFFVLEARYTLFQLTNVIEMRNKSQIEGLLANRWQRIIKLNNQYLHDFTNPVNEVCIKIAQLLVPMLNKPYLTIIMPTLAEVPPDLYITTSYDDEELNLKEVILSDSNDRLIHVLDALDNAVEDGKLKHNSLFQEGVSRQAIKELSPSEKNRVISRHPSVSIAHEALQARIAFKYYGETAGAALNALIKGLNKGSAKEQGRKYEYDAGEMANIAIGEFNEYLSMVSEVNPMLIPQLMATGKMDRFRSDNPEVKTVESCWRLLSARDPKFLHTNIKEEMPIEYCIGTIGHHLEEILQANPHLYELMSYGEKTLMTFQEFNVRSAQTRADAQSDLQTLSTHPCYNQQCDYKQRVELIKALAEDPLFILHLKEICFVMTNYAGAIIPNNQEMIKYCKIILLRISQEYPPLKIMSALGLTTAEVTQEFIQLTQFQKPTISRPTRFFDSPENRKRKAEPRPDSGFQSAREAEQEAKRMSIEPH